MLKKARSGRDAFRFSLRGVMATGPFGPLPAVSDEFINSVIDLRMSRGQTDSRDFAQRVEDMLARYFAPGWDKTAQAPGRQVSASSEDHGMTPATRG